MGGFTRAPRPIKHRLDPPKKVTPPIITKWGVNTAGALVAPEGVGAGRHGVASREIGREALVDVEADLPVSAVTRLAGAGVGAQGVAAHAVLGITA